MSEVVKKPLKITETVLRDAHQSLIATRIKGRSMGSSQKIKRRLQKYKAPDAFPWTEYLRISSICR